MPLISVKDLVKIYDGTEAETIALRGLSFEVKKGEFVAIMGPSGSGKSTLLHIMGFLDRPTKGRYSFNGKNMDSYDDNELAQVRNENMGFVFQAFNLLKRTDVYDNVMLPLIYSDIPNGEKDRRVIEAIKAVGLYDRITHSQSQLSGGEQQRVAIARALVMNPDVIFADEPTGNLDTESSCQIMGIINDLHKQGRTIILITHERDVARYAQRLLKIRDGQIESDKAMKNRRRTQKKCKDN